MFLDPQECQHSTPTPRGGPIGLLVHDRPFARSSPTWWDILAAFPRCMGFVAKTARRLDDALRGVTMPADGPRVDGPIEGV